MKAAVIRGPRNIVIEDRPVPEPRPGQTLIRVRAVGICGSDIRGFSEENSIARRPGLIIGHEASGEIVAPGSAAAKLAPGTRVAIDPQVVCGNCVPCRKGWTSVCDNKKVIGSSLRGFLDGAMAEYLSVDESMLYPIPDNLDFPEAATVEPVSNALHAVARGNVRSGDSVLVVGLGTLGLCILQAARLAGAGTVIGVGSSSAHRMDTARALGADIVHREGEEDLVRMIRDETGGTGADVVIDAAGNERSLALAVASARKRGRLVAFGNSRSKAEIDLMGIINKELEVFGSSGANEETVRAVELLASGDIDVGPIITHRMGLSEVQSAFELLLDPKHEAIKIVIMP